MTVPVIDIAEIEQALSDERLIKRAAEDLAVSLELYARAGNHSAHGVIRWLDGLRRSLNATRRQRAEGVDAEI